MWKWMGLLFRKNHLSRCSVWLSLLHWIGALILSLLLNLSPRKLEPWFVLWSFLLLRLLCISINLLCGHVWAGGHVWTGAFVKLQKRICRIVGPLLAASYELLTHHWNVASLSLFYRYYFGWCSSEMALLVPPPYSCKRSARYSDRLDDLSVTIPTFARMSMSTVSFRNSLPIECFPLLYDLSGFKSRINWHLLTDIFSF